MDLSLTHEQYEQVIRFLLHRMDQHTRGDLMRSLPMAYVALFPGTAAPVLAKVRAALGEIEGE